MQVARLTPITTYWNPGDPGQGWLADPALAAIRRPFDLQDLHDAVRGGVGGRPVTATVLVQSVARTDESERLLATAGDDDLVVAVVGWVDLTTDVAAEVAERLGGLDIVVSNAGIGSTGE